MNMEPADKVRIIDNSLDKYLLAKNNPQSVIYDAMRYSVFAGGKRLRPLLMWETAVMCGGTWEDVEIFACAIEMIHTYSLIHDDLPAMDNDVLRRGIPTNHIKYGEATAILAGDALLNKAFEIVSDAEYTDAALAMRAMAKLAEASGTEGMIGGQVVDLSSEGKDIGLSHLQYIHLLKTGAIIRSACVIGGILTGANESELSAIDDFAENLGIAFQIRDDILDVTGSEKSLGKPIGSDVKQKKNTYASLVGLAKSEELVREYSERAKAALAMFGEKADILLELTDRLINRKN